MSYESEDIEEFRSQEQTATAHSKPKRVAAQRRQITAKYSKAILSALNAKDSRAYGEQLRKARIVENSEDWNRAWKIFYDAL
jgi:hypothetical protein